MRDIKRPLLTMPLADLENKGVLPLYDAVGNAVDEQVGLQFAVCTSWIYVGLPTHLQTETSEYM